MEKSKSAGATRPSGRRRDQLASLEAAQKKKQRRRTASTVVLCVVLATALLAYPVYLVVNDYRASSASIEQVGVALEGAGCDPVVEDAATGNQNHVADGAPVSYPQTPPASGPHYASPASFTKRFYTADDRPAVATLVHNLEHAYTVVWYRDTMPTEQLDDLERIAKSFASDQYDPEQKLITAPWGESDGGGFPEGKNVVLTRWYADPQAPSDATKQKGVRQSCSTASGAAVKDFMSKYPYTASPEPEGA